MKKIIILSSLFITFIKTYAQFTTEEYKILNHVGIGATVGTTGIGLELASPIGQFFQVRTGVNYMPYFKYDMDFGIQLGDEPAGKFDADGNLTHFGKLADMLKGFTGYEPDEHVTMVGSPKFTNFKFLVDVLPFENKKWHFTLGFYAGREKVAKAVNEITDAPTVLAVNIYNNLYDKVLNEEEIFMGLELPPDVAERILNYGKMGMVLGNYRHDIKDETGNIIHKKGEPYRMFPNEESMIKSFIKANKIRPYLGFGYGNTLSRNKKINCSFDCGVMYLGGVHVYTHDGTCLSHDVKNYCSSIKTYMNIFNNAKVYPVIDFRISYRLF